MAPAAPVHFDEVKIPVTEVKLAILVLMAHKTHTDAPGLAVA